MVFPLREEIILSLSKEVASLQQEVSSLKRQLKEAMVWITALIRLQGGEVEIPQYLLISSGEKFKIEHHHNSLNLSEVLKLSQEEEPNEK